MTPQPEPEPVVQKSLAEIIVDSLQNDKGSWTITYDECRHKNGTRLYYTTNGRVDFNSEAHIKFSLSEQKSIYALIRAHNEDIRKTKAQEAMQRAKAKFGH